MVVIDTSVAFKWFAKDEEELLPNALSLLDNHLHHKEVLIAPDLILYELANAWSTKTELTIGQIKAFMQDLGQTKITIEPITTELINKAVIFSKKYTVSVYDASYAVLAKQKDCTYITADFRFVNKVDLPYIKHLEDYI
jgi:predicted nucleic acid-binding protein